MISKLLCSIAKALGGCSSDIPPPATIVEVAGSSPRIKDQTPTDLWLSGILPTYNVKDLIKHFEYRISIHETYWGLVEDDPVRWLAFGNAEFHQWAIEGYSNAIYYLRRTNL